MKILLHDLCACSAARFPDRLALTDRKRSLRFSEAFREIESIASQLRHLGLARGERVAIYLEKRVETVVALFACSRAAGIFVPVNPLLRAKQLAHVLRDSGASMLVTSASRLAQIQDLLSDLPALRTVLVVGEQSESTGASSPQIVAWDPQSKSALPEPARGVDSDVAAILYTSGSTGRAKGVVLSHRNLLVGAASVAEYIGNTADDTILAVLPLSFDAGLSQVTTAFESGAHVVLLDYLLPRDVIKACAKHRVTGITGVPPLWIKLAQEPWPEEATAHLRYFANTGGHMPKSTLDALRAIAPKATPFLMYGLTEAFRSTYLDPAEIDRRPDSIGKAIPNAEVLVVDAEGKECAPGEIGELVHRGPLVSLGYWKDPERSADRFRPLPGQCEGLVHPELAVWSGDLVRSDDQGFLYFVGREDDMIKTSGYRVSPTEVEEGVLGSGLVREAAALGRPDPELGHAILVLVVPNDADSFDMGALQDHCRRTLPSYMLPRTIEVHHDLPRNANGKVDRAKLRRE